MNYPIKLIAPLPNIRSPKIIPIKWLPNPIRISAPAIMSAMPIKVQRKSVMKEFKIWDL